MILSQRFDVFDYCVFQKRVEYKSEITIYWAITNLTISFSLGKAVAFTFRGEENL